jgi:hypothetical protein
MFEGGGIGLNDCKEAMATDGPDIAAGAVKQVLTDISIKEAGKQYVRVESEWYFDTYAVVDGTAFYHFEWSHTATAVFPPGKPNSQNITSVTAKPGPMGLITRNDVNVSQHMQAVQTQYKLGDKYFSDYYDSTVY